MQTSNISNSGVMLIQLLYIRVLLFRCLHTYRNVARGILEGSFVRKAALKR